MPKEDYYYDENLSSQLRKLAQHHSNPKTRHLSKFELNMLEKAAKNLTGIQGFSSSEGLNVNLPISNFEGELLDYRAIWSSIQEYPTLSSAASELELSNNRLRRINTMLNNYWAEGVLEEWLLVIEQIRAYSDELDTSKQVMEIYSEYLGDPINNNRPTEKEIIQKYNSIVSNQ